MVVRLDAPQPTFVPPPIDQIPDGVEDKPKSGLPLVICIVLHFFASYLFYLQEILGPFRFPALVFGAASFSHQYNDDDHLASLTPLRTVRLALRYV
jgi:D-arabinose 1-dehydrogenase